MASKLRRRASMRELISWIILIAAICIFSLTVAYSQNLVQNGSFENVTGVDSSAAGVNDTANALIVGAGCFYYWAVSYPTGWHTTNLTPDRLVEGTICPPWDNDTAASGKAYLVIGNTEAVIDTLTTPLQTNYTYRLSFSVQRETMSGSAGAATRIGFYFKPAGDIILSPFITNAVTWQRYTYEFTATTNAIALEVRGLINAAGTKIDSIVLEPYQPLPVELIKFNVEYQAPAIVVTWLTGSEINCSYFEVQRSNDGVFYTIGRVNGFGNSSSVQSYTFTDLSPFIGRNYYRLKQVDYDGQTTFSKIVGVDYTRWRGRVVDEDGKYINTNGQSLRQDQYKQLIIKIPIK
jgi:hypothetical protein